MYDTPEIVVKIEKPCRYTTGALLNKIHILSVSENQEEEIAEEITQNSSGSGIKHVAKVLGTSLDIAEGWRWMYSLLKYQDQQR